MVGPYVRPARQWETWTSPVSPHVSGRYEVRTADDPEQHVVITCAVCKQHCRCQGMCTCPAEFRVLCTSGQPRGHIARMAAVHLHRHPMALAKPR